MAGPPAEFDGLYTIYGMQPVRDDKAARNLGYGYDTGLPGPHGTYTRIPFFWVRTENAVQAGKTIENGALLILDHNGDFCRFVWHEDQDAWVLDPSSYSFPCVPTSAFPGNASPVTKLSTLVLDAYTQADAPSGAKAGDFYIGNKPRTASPGKMPSWPKAQKVRFDTTTGKFTWFTDQYPDGLEFQAATAQPHEDCTDGKGCFGDVFQVQDHGYGQLAFPFCGFKPDALMTNGPQWTGISTPGTGIMYEDDDPPPGGTKQDYGGTLVFNFPARNSRDYMASENVDGEPNFPLGFRARGQKYAFGDTLSQLISTSQEEMDSWKIGLGLSGGIEKVLDVGLSGTYSNSSSISRETTSRYAVTRKCGQSWYCVTDPPNLTLRKEFIEEVQTRLKQWMAEDPKQRGGMDLNWKGFVRQFGTHYLHAMTQGWIEMSTQVFSVQAESVAKQQGWSLQATAKGTVDGISGKTQSSLEESFEQKFGTKVESDTVRYFNVGSDASPVAIFLDLRLLSELFSPVFFQYDPVDETESLAPVVWYDLRASFERYLDMFPTPTLINYSPRMFQLRILSITYKVTLKDYGATIYTYATGAVNVTADSRDQSAEGKAYCQQIGTSGNMYVHGSCVNDTGFHPDASFSATVSVAPSYTGPIKLCVETVFTLSSLGQTGPQQSVKYYASFAQGVGSATLTDDGGFVEIAVAFAPVPASM
jgi:hypothetical protein